MPSLSLIPRLFCWSVLVFLVAPTLIVIPMAFGESTFLAFPPSKLSLRWFEAFLSDPQWMTATYRSLWVAFCVMVLATALATVSVIVVADAAPWLRQSAHALIISPMILPVIAYAVAIYGVYSRLQLIGTDFGLVLAHTILAIPFPFLTVSASYALYDRTLSLAAASSGASPWQVFWHVTFPSIRPGVIAGALFAFLTSFDEVIVAMFIGGVESTLPKKMFDHIRFELSPVLAAIATLLTLLTSVVLLATRTRTAVSSSERAAAA